MRTLKRKGWLVRALCMLSIAALLSSTALALGGNTLVLNYQQNGVRFDLYRVADIASDGGYTLAGDFKDYSVALPGEGWREAAATLAAYAERDRIESSASGTTANGTVTFQELEDGLYLVVGAVSTSGDYSYTPVPFLVEVSGGKHVPADVKYDRTGGGSGGGDDYAAYTVVKAWKDDSEQERPGSVTVQLLRDGKVYDTVTLNGSNGWKHTWPSLNTSYRWQITEEDVPEGYTVSVSQSGQTFTVTNTGTTPDQPPVNPGGPDDPDGPDGPDDPDVPDNPDVPDVPDNPDVPDHPARPDNPDIPQTGQLWWPIPVLALGGILLFLIGWVRRKKWSQTHEA